MTGRLEPKYPKWKRSVKFYGVSVPVVFLCLVIAFIIMLYYFSWQDVVDRYRFYMFKQKDDILNIFHW